MNARWLPEEALRRLQEGSRRSSEGRLTHHDRIDDASRERLLEGQHPYAAILGCADSRVVPEHIFDAAPGELFVCRNAGNQAGDVVLGSLEYAVAHAGCAVICVLAHSSCGAVAAAVGKVEDPAGEESAYIEILRRNLLPPVMRSLDSGPEDPRQRVDAAARANAIAQADRLLRHSTLLRDAVAEGTLHVLPAFYELSSGSVTFLDATPGSGESAP